jgi:hypothetical protein
MPFWLTNPNAAHYAYTVWRRPAFVVHRSGCWSWRRLPEDPTFQVRFLGEAMDSAAAWMLEHRVAGEPARCSCVTADLFVQRSRDTLRGFVWLAVDQGAAGQQCLCCARRDAKAKVRVFRGVKHGGEPASDVPGGRADRGRSIGEKFPGAQRQAPRLAC